MAFRNVLVTGAGGYVGLAVAAELRARGCTVYGWVRSDSSAALLERHEIKPLVGDLAQAPQRIAELGIQAVVETHTMTADAAALTRSLLAALPAGGRYLYCSGCLVYGDRPGAACLESDAVPPSRRQEVEQVVLDAKGTVLRPAFVFGQSGGKFASRYWAAGQTGEVVLRGDPEKTWAWVHVGDVATAFHLCLCASDEQVQGQIFNLADGAKTVFRDLVCAMSEQHTGTALPVTALPAEAPIDQALDKSCYYTGEKAERVLGWRPTRQPFLSDLATYHRSWAASQ